MKKKIRGISGVILLFLIIAGLAIGIKKSLNKLPSNNPGLTNQNNDSLKKVKVVSLLVKSVFIDFETPGQLETENHVTSEKAFSGKRSMHIDEKTEYGDVYKIALNKIADHGRINKIAIGFKLFSAEVLKGLRYVVEINNGEDKNVFWTSYDLEKKTYRWEEKEKEFEINPAIFKKDLIVKIYPWSQEKGDFFIDDLQIDFYADYVDDGQDRASEYSTINHNYTIDFENPAGLENANSIADDIARSGKYSCKLSSSSEYGAGIKKKIKDVTEDSIKDIFMSAWIYPESEKNDLVLVAIVSSPDGKTKTWQGKSTGSFKLKKHEWQLMNAWLSVSEAHASPDDYITLYPWDKGKTNLQVDDMQIVFGRRDVREGNAPNADMTVIKNNEYKPQGNKPPFETNYLQKMVINFNEGGFLNKQDSMTAIFPDALCFAGRFLINDSKDEIGVISNGAFKMYRYCIGEKSFRTILSSNEKYFSDPLFCYIKGKFSGTAREEIIAINKKTGQSFFLEFSSTKEACSGKAEMKGTAQQIGLANISLNPLTIDANNDGKDELLVFNNTSLKWMLFKYNGNFELEASGPLGDLGLTGNLTAVSYSSLLKEGKNVLLVSTPDNNKVFTYSSASKTFSIVIADHDFKNIINNSDKFFNVGAGAYLKFSKQDRFDLKLIHFDNQGMNILKNIDFAGYESDYNPKYYEMSEIVVGKFLDGAKPAVLVIAANCNDVDFNGHTCRSFSQLDYLPNKVEIYTISPD